jgi:hypothetical protein
MPPVMSMFLFPQRLHRRDMGERLGEGVPKADLPIPPLPPPVLSVVEGPTPIMYVIGYESFAYLDARLPGRLNPICRRSVRANC